MGEGAEMTDKRIPVKAWAAAIVAIIGLVLLGSDTDCQPLVAAEHRLAAAEQAPVSTDRMRTLPDVSSRWVNPPAPYVPKPGTWE